MENNKKDIKLLQNNPQGLILKYQGLIEFIVDTYVIHGFFNRYDRDDIIQSINESLLRKIPKLQKQYNNSTRVKTYISVIIRNNCKEILRKSRIEIVDVKNIENLQSVVNEPELKLVLTQEFDRLEKIFMMYYRQRYKLELCFKLLYNIPVKFKDFKNYSADFDKYSYLKIIKDINPGTEIRKRKIYRILLPYFNLAENKDNSEDALRKWLRFKTNEIIRLLNGDPPVSSYDEESLQILLEKYYFEKTNKTKK